LEDIISITSGHFHSLALDKNGSVYAFGSNRNGQLGVAMDMTEFVSHSMRDIIFIAAGGNTSGFLDNKGKVCLCGIIRTNSLRCPHEIKILSNIISASVQGYRSLFLSNEGKIFGFVDAGMNQISIAELVSSGALATLVTPDGRWVLTNQGELREIRSQRIIKVIL
jgi:alpha-tubulin suppressor-like RCC1 family protein